MIIYQFAYITIGLFSFSKTLNEQDKKIYNPQLLPAYTTR